MTDYESFMTFFKGQGVVFETGENTHLHYKDARKDSFKFIQVSETYFHFNVKGAFLGFESDETGIFTAASK